MKRFAILLLLLFEVPALAAPRFTSLWQKIVITEVMVAPSQDEMSGGQWVEIQNISGEPFNMQGLVLFTMYGAFHVVSPSMPLVVNPGQTLLLAPFKEALLPQKVGYAYGADFHLNEGEDVILLVKAGDIVDAFGYGLGSIPVRPGASFSLEPYSSGVKHWCYGREVFDLAGNLGSPGAPNPYCDDDNDGFAEDQGDCNDENPAVGPMMTEVCNGIDDDCNGLVDDVMEPPIDCLQQGVCLGTSAVCHGPFGWVCPYPDTFEQQEVSCDGLDNDCDGETDNIEPPPGLCLETGVCRGVEPQCPGAQGWHCPYPVTYEPEEITCDGLDNDCDGETDENLGGDDCTIKNGFGVCVGKTVCVEGTLICDAPAPRPERCNGLDDNCDGATDEGFPVDEKCYAGRGACRTVGKYRCSDDGESVVCGAVPIDPQSEICDDGQDNDCDGQTDEQDCLQPTKSKGGCSAGHHSCVSLIAVGLSLLVILRGQSRSWVRKPGTR